MPARISAVDHLDGYRLRLTFADGAVGEVDLGGWIVNRGGLFLSLEDPEVFRQVRVDPELETIAWPNGVDFCPDVLHALITGVPLHEEPQGRMVGEHVG